MESHVGRLGASPKREGLLERKVRMKKWREGVKAKGGGYVLSH